jgi:hypothetical protein
LGVGLTRGGVQYADSHHSFFQVTSPLLLPHKQ